MGNYKFRLEIITPDVYHRCTLAGQQRTEIFICSIKNHHLTSELPASKYTSITTTSLGKYKYLRRRTLPEIKYNGVQATWKVFNKTFLTAGVVDYSLCIMFMLTFDMNVQYQTEWCFHATFHITVDSTYPPYKILVHNGLSSRYSLIQPICHISISKESTMGLHQLQNIIDFNLVSCSEIQQKKKLKN